MQRKVISIRWRFIVAAIVLAALALPAIFYAQSRVRNASQDSLQLIQEHRDLGWVLNSLKDSIQVSESAIYQYPLALDDRGYNNVLVRIADTLAQSRQLNEHYVVKKYRVFADFAANLQYVLQRLETETNELLQALSKVSTRYPAAPILMDEMHPTNIQFLEAVDLAMAESLETPNDRDQQQILRLLESLRYTWSQHVSEVRLFVANRSGVFGQPHRSMLQNITNREMYAQRVEELLNQLKDYGAVGKLGFQQTISLQKMIAAKADYDRSFQRAASIYSSKDWRADMPILRDKIRPILDQSWGIVELMQEELDELAQKNMLRDVNTADVLSNIIWVFTGFMALLLFISYLVFEYVIRQPLLEVSNALDAAGRGENYLPVLRSPTEETAVLVDAFRRMQGQVVSRQTRLESILDNAAEGIITIDEHGKVETFNNAAQKLFGYGSEESLGRFIMDLVPFSDNSAYLNFLTLCQSLAASDISHETTVTVQRRDKTLFPMAIKVNELEIDGRHLYIAIVEDIGDRVAMMDHLREMAEHDSLTGLYNRQYFMNELDRLVENARRGSHRNFALLYIDLDNFKYVNDTLGHLAGDRVLVEVTDMLSHRNRRSDLLARLGGDEFAILIYDVENEAEVRNAANAHRKLLADYVFKHEGSVVHLGCSIGVTLFGREATSKEDLMAQADIACHVAKRSGRNRIHVYEPDDMQNMTAMSEDMGWARRIREAIEKDRFRLACQPIMELKTGEVYKQEVLLRMDDDHDGIVLPAGFLSSAERFGLMRAVDRWVINHAIEYLGKQLKRNPRLHFSINLSAESVGEPAMLEVITNALLRHEVPPTSITFEITETVAIANLSTAVDFLTQLRNLGCLTALDDFGVGYSSFAYLKDLPVDCVKIDGSFVRNIHRDALQMAMVRSMNDIAHAMGKYTIAEFVDSSEAMRTLKEIGVDYIQGYHVGGPRLVSDDTLFMTESNVIRLV